MKKLLHLSALIVLTFAGNTGYTQKSYSNSVKLMSGSYLIPARQEATLHLKQIGVSYERRVFKNFFAGAAYHRWTNIGDRRSAIAVMEPEHLVDKKDGLTGRYNYKMVDINLLYKYQVGNRHTINAGVGASYCQGNNIYWDNPRLEDPYIQCLILFRQQRVSYYGIVPQISYDYNFIRNRLNAGVDLRARYYTGRAPGQYDYGIHVGVNF